MKESFIPADSKNFEVFAIKMDDNGKWYAYLGFTLNNGNFHYINVPYTEPINQRKKF